MLFFVGWNTEDKQICPILLQLIFVKQFVLARDIWVSLYADIFSTLKFKLWI